MKEILSTLLLLGAVLMIYLSMVGGPDGLEGKVKSGGGRIQETVQRLNP